MAPILADRAALAFAAVEPTPQEAANVRRALKRLRAEPVAFEAVTTRGHTPARRWIVSLADGRSAFAKVAADELTAAWIRDEHLVCSMVRDASFMPRYLGFFDDGEHPVHALEDLSVASCPPPWDVARIEAVLQALRVVAATPVPEGLPRAADDHLELRDGWAEVARDPAAFLELGLSTRGAPVGGEGARSATPRLNAAAGANSCCYDPWRRWCSAKPPTSSRCFEAEGSA
jgi:hypothetical protein